MTEIFTAFLVGVAFSIVGMVFYRLLRVTETSASKLGKRVAERAGEDPALAARIEALIAGKKPPIAPAAPSKPAAPPRPTGESLRLLGILQSEARLVDFLLENIQQVDDATLTAYVREVHQKASAALKKHVTLEPIRSEQEDATVTIPAGFDPSAVRLIGEVTGQPPFTGTLIHPGWKVTRLDVPKLPEGADGMILAPAEVELK